MLFAIQNFLQSLFISNVTNSLSQLRVKGDKRARLTSFSLDRKGVRNMETIFFSDHNRKSV